MSEKNVFEIANFEIISTPVGVCITFFAEAGIKKSDAGTFRLNNGDLVVDNDDQELRFKDGASSRTLQSVNELSLVGVKPSGDIIVDMDCEFKNIT